MLYTLEKYKDNKRFNEQYNSIHEFLKNSADIGYNEHFHWGRFEWMMNHDYLDVENLNKIGIFKDENRRIVGLVTYDTEYEDNTYLIHSIDDKELLLQMLNFAKENYCKDNKTSIVASSKDKALIDLLKELKSSKTDWKDYVLEFDLNNDLNYEIENGYHISSKDFVYDSWKYNVVIHKGFNHEGLPERKDNEIEEVTPNYNQSLKVFVINEKHEYCAHCGVWYTEGESAYIEPVVTIPECRMKGFAKAVVYEAIKRAKELGAKRAVVLSDQEFYYKIGFKRSSEFAHWDL